MGTRQDDAEFLAKVQAAGARQPSASDLAQALLDQQGARRATGGSYPSSEQGLDVSRIDTTKMLADALAQKKAEKPRPLHPDVYIGYIQNVDLFKTRIEHHTNRMNESGSEVAAMQEQLSRVESQLAGFKKSARPEAKTRIPWCTERISVLRDGIRSMTEVQARHRRIKDDATRQLKALDHVGMAKLKKELDELDLL